jgi:hypothetical protein
MSGITDDDRHRIAEAPFELARRASWFGAGPAFGGIANEYFTVLADDDNGGDLGGIGAE